MAKKKQDEQVQEEPQVQEEQAKEGFVKVRYEGPEGYVNYDIAPYNLVEDPQIPGTYGQRALLDPGGEYEVPEELAENLAVTGGFEPADEKSEEAFRQYRGEHSEAASASEAPEEDASEAEDDEASSEDADGGDE